MPKITVEATGSITVKAINGITTEIRGPGQMNIKTDGGIDGKILVGLAKLLEVTARLEQKIVGVADRKVSAALIRGQNKNEIGQLVQVQFNQIGRRGPSVMAGLINEQGQPVCGVDADIPGNEITVYAGVNTGGDITLREQS